LKIAHKLTRQALKISGVGVTMIFSYEKYKW